MVPVAQFLTVDSVLSKYKAEVAEVTKMIIIDGVKYDLIIPEDESQLEEMVKEHAKEIFGENCVYFDLKQKITSKSGIVSIPDGYVIDLSGRSWYIVEGELSSHPLHEHVTAQLNKFYVGIKNLAAQRELIDALYKEIDSNKVLRAYVETKIGSAEIKGFLLDLISKSPKIVVIIEEMGDKVREACDGLKAEPVIVEFKTFVREDAPNVHAHLFEPLYAIEKISEKGKEEEEGKRHKSWEAKLGWVDTNTREIAKALIEEIPKRFGEVSHRPSADVYCFWKGNMSSEKRRFAVLRLTKARINIRIRTDPTTFKDPAKLTGEKVYKGWFFKHGQEREFKIASKEQIPLAMVLIQQSYDISGETL